MAEQGCMAVWLHVKVRRMAWTTVYRLYAHSVRHINAPL